MSAAAAALALALAAPALAQTSSGSWDARLGGGATGLLAGALRFLAKEGHPNACLSGMRADVNLYTPAEDKDPRTRAGAINRFHFFFWSPDKPPTMAVSINLPIEGGPAPQQARYNEYDPYYSPPPAIFDVRPTCISELNVDTDKALAAAAKHGLPLGTMSAYELKLIHAAGPSEPDWSDKSLRRKAFWAVSLSAADSKTETQYLVDAVTGRFLKARTVKKSR